jgi:hypothetical protein
MGTKIGLLAVSVKIRTCHLTPGHGLYLPLTRNLKYILLLNGTTKQSSVFNHLGLFCLYNILIQLHYSLKMSVAEQVVNIDSGT